MAKGKSRIFPLLESKKIKDLTTGIWYNVSDLITPADNCRMGFYDYNDLATQTTPISVPAGLGSWTVLTNDGLGAFTNKTYKPVGFTEIFDGVTNEFVFDDFKLGDMLDIRLDITVTTTQPNQEVNTRIRLGSGAGEYGIPFTFDTFKTAGAKAVNRYNGIYMGDANTLNNPAQFEIQSDSPCTVVVNGWYCKVILRG